MINSPIVNKGLHLFRWQLRLSLFRHLIALVFHKIFIFFLH